mmetsp:Transcript_55711/g.154330  ORF Transcript_55711/g.154330 Transcript_55711/m.154330 type:complete len:404 (-) Transcript_55711:88-1299(-)
MHDNAKDMRDLVDDANTAIKTRDDMQGELAQLKARAEAESAEFEREWKELTKAIEDDRKNFGRGGGAGAGGSDSKRGDLTIQEEKNLKKKIAQGAWMIGKDKAQIQVSQDKVASYEEAFSRIQSATGINDIDELVDKFIEAEDKNYSLFKYVNQMATDIEKLEASVAETKAEIEKYRGAGVNSDNQRKRILKELEQRLEKTTAKSESYDTKYQAAMTHINQLKTSIVTIFNKIGCNTPAVAELLGNQGVTEANLMQYLGIIEQRINELLHAYTALLKTADGAGSASLAMSMSLPKLPSKTPADMFEEPTPERTSRERAGKSGAGRERKMSRPTARPVLKVAPPDWDDLSSDEGSDDEDTRPLTLEELHRTPLRFRAKPKHHKHHAAGTRIGAGEGPSKGRSRR